MTKVMVGADRKANLQILVVIGRKPNWLHNYCPCACLLVCLRICVVERPYTRCWLVVEDCCDLKKALGGWCSAGSVIIGMAIGAPGKSNCNKYYYFQWSRLVPHCGHECFTQPATVAFIMLMQHNCINHHHHQLAIHKFDLKLNVVNFLIYLPHVVVVFVVVAFL